LLQWIRLLGLLLACASCANLFGSEVPADYDLDARERVQGLALGLAIGTITRDSGCESDAGIYWSVDLHGLWRGSWTSSPTEPPDAHLDTCGAPFAILLSGFGPGPSDTYAMLDRLNRAIGATFTYAAREGEGVQTQAQTLRARRGSCRDYAALFIEACRASDGALTERRRKMHILVDADACPNTIKDILFRAAERVGVRMTLIANRALKIPPSPHIRLIQVPGGFDQADNRIVELVVAGDLVITADIPLAAAVIAKGAVALNPRGELYTPDNVRELLALRNFMDELRSSGVDTGGPGALSQSDRQSFAKQLERLLAANPNP